MSHFENESISEDEIAALATAKVLERGRALFDDGALEEPVRRGDELSALCAGSEDEAYEVHVRLAARGVGATRCSCPYDYDGLCKHRVALLLAFAHTPEAFETIESKPAKKGEAEGGSNLLRDLRSRERDELAQLIVQLVETEPKLRGVVRRLLQTRLTESEIDKVRNSVAALMKKIARMTDESNFSSIGRDLKFHLRAAQSLELTRPLDAGRLYAAIWDGLMSAGEEAFPWDERGILMDAAVQCSETLARLLPDAPAARRREWLEIFARAFVFDAKMGGTDFAADAAEVLPHASDDEWPTIEAILDAACVPQRKTVLAMPAGKIFGAPREIEEIDRYSNRWMRQSIVELKAERFKRQGDDTGARRLLLEQGTPEQQAEAHLQSCNFDAAIALANAHFDRYSGLLQSFAAQLEQAGQWPRAREFARRHNLHQWLAETAAARRDPDALQLNIELFEESPYLEQWLEVLRLAAQGEREATRAQLWKYLEKQNAHALQFDIALHEDDVESALQLWEKLNAYEKHSRYESLARAAEENHPDEAFLRCDEWAQSLIAGRSRDAYRLAAKALQRGKKILESSGCQSEWDSYIASLRAQHPKLRALNEELDKAKL